MSGVDSKRESPLEADALLQHVSLHDQGGRGKRAAGEGPRVSGVDSKRESPLEADALLQHVSLHDQ